MYQFYNPNPSGKAVGDCTIRALTKALDMTWDDVYILLTVEGYQMCDMPSSNIVWGNVLRNKGFEKKACHECSTFSHFAEMHPDGTFLVCTGTHVACVKDATLYDSWNSQNEVVDFYYQKEAENGL